ncbi:MAG TPA: cystathionine beta-lyase [Rhizomicrobium sp.]|jgi:cystathionine beta-lyase|nr:cystathionine beta-lyase [Rhizomicrobium sp.]
MIPEKNASKRSIAKDTLAVHAGRMSREHFGVVNTPVYRASTILYDDFEALDAAKAPFIYGRLGTPSSKSLEDAVNALEGAGHTVLCSSGMNAIATAILAVCSAGDHLLMTDSCYEPTRTFCDRTLRRLAVETTYYDPRIGAGIAGLFRSNTRAVFCESPGSLTFEVQDVPAIAATAHAHGASVLLDNTWATPLFFEALGRGVDLSIQAATKYIGGHADVMIGYVAANDGHAKRLRDAHHDLGLYASGDDCFLALRGLRTMPVRLQRHQETALRLARWLKGRPEVERVLHPALEDDPGHAIWKRDFNGASGLFGIVLKPGPREGLAAFFDGLVLFGRGYSWGGYESLIVPAHIRRTAREFAAEGPVLRIHAGLENADDLIAELDAQFERLRARSG